MNKRVLTSCSCLFAFVAMLLSSAFLKALPGGYWHWYAIAAVFTVLPIAVGPRWLRVVACCGLVYAAVLVERDYRAGKIWKSEHAKHL